MRTKQLNIVLKALSVLLLLSACAKATYDGRLRATPFDNKMSNPPADNTNGRQQGRTDNNNTGGTRLPVISFTTTQVLMNSKLEAQLEVQLSEPSNVPVVAEVRLFDGSAKHHRDYNGFKTPTRNYEVKQTVVFAPKETRKSLPIIGGRVRYVGDRSCDTQFRAQIMAMKLQNARVSAEADRSMITVPCFESPQRPVPPPVICPDPVPEMPLAQFEEDPVYARPGQNKAVARIILDKTYDKAVVVGVKAESLNESIKPESFKPYSEQLMIAPGMKSLDVPVEIVRGDICLNATQFEGVVTVAEFNIVVKEIANAVMTDRVARVIVQDDLSKCKPNVPPPAPKIPLVKFEQTKLEAKDGVRVVTARLMIADGQPSKEDIIIDLATADGLAKEGVNYNRVSQAAVIKAGETFVDVQVTLLKPDMCADNKPSNNGGDFFINVTAIKNAEMNDRQATVMIAPDLSECKPVLVEAYFENLNMKNDLGSTDVTAKILLKSNSKLPVVLNIETVSDSAKSGADFIELKLKGLTIKPGDTSVEIPLKLVNDGKCVTAEEAEENKLKAPPSFKVVVTEINNAVMNERMASVTIVKEAKLCPPVNSPPPTVNSPAPVKPGPPVNSPPPTVNSPTPVKPPPTVNSPTPNKPKTPVNSPKPNKPKPPVNSPIPTKG